MTITSVTEVLTPKTEADLVAEELKVLADADPPIGPAAMQPGSILRTLVVADARALADAHQVISQIAAASFLDTAAAIEGDDGAWLDLRVKSTFNLTRLEATRARGSVTLSCVAGSGPFTIGPAALVVGTATGLRYRSSNVANVIVPSGGSVSIGIIAEGTGSTYNRPGESLTVLVTPANAGMSFAAAGGTAWRTESAVDRESNASLVARARARWAVLSAGAGTRAAYEYLLRSATMENTDVGTPTGVTRIGFAPVPGTGVVGMAVAGSTGLLTDAQRDATRTYVTARCALTDTPVINHASTVEVDMTGAAVEFVAGSNTVTNQSKVAAAIEAFVNGFPMGSDSTAVLIDEAAIAAAIYGAVPRGTIRNVTLHSGDVTLPALTIGIVDTTLIAWS